METHLADLNAATEYVAQGDLARLGEVMEFSTLKMHASALAARPGLWYVSPITWGVMNHVRQLREDGERCYFTMDAGPHVKVLCSPADAPRLVKSLESLDGVLEVNATPPGQDAYIMDES